MLSNKAVSRLTVLANTVEKLPRQQFNMRSCFTPHETGRYKPGAVIARRDLKNGTACALGVAGLIPAFVRGGLKIKMRGDRRGFAYYKNRMEFDAAESFFDVTNDQAFALFESVRMPVRTPKQWAAACRRFIKNQGVAHAG